MSNLTKEPNKDAIPVQYKDQVHSKTGHEGVKGEYMYSFTLSLASALDSVGAIIRPIFKIIYRENYKLRHIT